MIRSMALLGINKSRLGWIQGIMILAINKDTEFITLNLAVCLTKKKMYNEDVLSILNTSSF